MLVLTRLKNESIMIGDQIELTVVDIRGDKVRIGIKAPAEIAIYRKEIYEAIQAENRAAAEMPASDLKKSEEELRKQFRKEDTPSNHDTPSSP